MAAVPAPKAPSRPVSGGRGFVLVGCAVLAAIGLAYVPFGLALGLLLGAAASLDPTWAHPAALVGHGATTLMFAIGGSVVALLCAVFAGATVARAEWAPIFGILAAAILLATGNLPAGLLALGLVIATFDVDALAARVASPPRS